MKQRIWLLFGVSTVAVIFIMSSAGYQGAGFAAGMQAADGRATHNMLVVGEEAVYLSHLPMFQENGEPPMPHRYQVILEVTFTNQDSYAKDRQQHPKTIYMLNPEKFVLPALASADPPGEPLRSFKAIAISRGHLERPGSRHILRDSEVSVKKVLHLQKFGPAAAKPDRLEYLLFGRGEELFMAHLIAAPPDFDQVLSVKVIGLTFNDEELAKGLRLVFPGTTNTPAGRLNAKKQATGQVNSDGPTPTTAVVIEVEGELYFEEGELRVPPNFETTSEEARAGFP